ncbi:hypothetical protein DWF00_16615 [Bosea caraganae]|uniref:DUF6894 domain-containing protein n=1 Tax=Bosea caraganae TaxID=2763117 RepID=A0A370KZV8_9HYPH|nr:hypothetical protein [Bosea caraganae]RDJ20132.1 hypothetical protein DWE98_26220 [Bosea caraganae]RDJ24844.1 hypothetical protein DWF00_16615 [Bosea caraganae]
MPRYFIDSSDGRHSDIDKEGLELSDDETARRIALDALPDMARDKLPDGDERSFRVCVRNSDGSVIYRARLDLIDEWLDGRV